MDCKAWEYSNVSVLFMFFWRETVGKWQWSAPVYTHVVCLSLCSLEINGDVSVLSSVEVFTTALFFFSLLLPQCTYSKWSPGKAVCRPTGCLFIIVVYLQRQTVGRLYADSGPLTSPPQTTLTPHTGSKCAIIFMYHRYRHSHTHTHTQAETHAYYVQDQNVPWLNERLTIYFFYVFKRRAK